MQVNIYFVNMCLVNSELAFVTNIRRCDCMFVQYFGPMQKAVREVPLPRVNRDVDSDDGGGAGAGVGVRS